LIQPTRNEVSEFLLEDSVIRIPLRGVSCSIIDYTFSRVGKNDTDAIYRPYDDDSYFQGEGDYQFEIYRLMRDVVTDEGRDEPDDHSAWKRFRPMTNIYWLHYLILKLLDQKNIRRGGRRGDPTEASDRSALIQLERRILGYSSAYDLITQDPFFFGLRQ
jgi:serine/threonine-protein kinase haspin